MVQIIWGVVIFGVLTEHFIWLATIMRVLATLLILTLMTKDDNPTYRMTWIVLVAVMPVFGTLVYLLMSNKKPTRKMAKTMNQIEEKHLADYSYLPDSYTELEKRDRRMAGISKYVQDIAHTSVSGLTDVKYFPSGEAMFEPLLEDLKKAEKSIFIEFFIVEDGVMLERMLEVLTERAAAGVEVRFIYDDFGCITRLPVDFPEEMAKLGIKTIKFNPVKPILSMVYNTRNHRKYVVIDSKISYTGGVNIADEYINVKKRFGYWKDNMIRVEGLAAWDYSVMFLNMWNSCQPTDESYEEFYPRELLKESPELLSDSKKVQEQGFVQPYSDSPLDNEPLGENVYRDMISYAQDYVYIYTPYLIISYELQTALTLAAKRGVRVIVMTPGIPDKPLIYRLTRSYYRQLLEGGVEIYEYSPGFLHAKTFIVDGVMANVGTINLDYRSLYLHFETSTLLYYHPEIEAIEEDYKNSLAESRQVTIEDTDRGHLNRLIESLLRLLAPFA